MVPVTYSVNSSDEELMEAVKGGDNRSFEVLYRRLSPKVYGYLRLRLQNTEDVDELFQKVFLKLHASRESYNAEYPVLQWVFVMARSALLDHVKSLKRKENLREAYKESAPLSQNTPEPSLSQQMDTNILRSLSSEAQVVVKLRVIDELGFEEISRLIGKSEVGVRKVLSRSLKKLRVSFGGRE